VIDFLRRIFVSALCDTCLPERQRDQEEGERRRIRLPKAAGWWLVYGDGKQRTERDICHSRGYPAISVKGFGYMPVVRGVGGRAPGDGTVLQLKAIFP